MDADSQTKDCQETSNPAVSNLLHFLFFSVLLSGLPLLLAITFSKLAGDSWDSLVSRYYADTLLTTFALSICICSEATHPSHKKILRVCSGASFIFAVICLCT